MKNLIINEKSLLNAGYKIGDTVELLITEQEIILKKHSPNFLKMAEKNPDLNKMFKSLNLAEIL